ncbi:tetratricopeptide repeat protein [Lyngbya aestuarii]|uniref:tetratricopeptide repeat protein n=1 Tax=Lyngbya aestuarii TaxID=118322 RepID=UPI00403E0554
MSKKRSPWVVLLLVLSVLAFIGISIIPLLGNISKDTQISAEVTPTPTSTISAEDRSELEAQAKGYELVVQREPDNVTALRGLLEVRLQLGDIKGAIAPLEKLAKLNPDQTDYGVLLAQARQQSGDLEGAAQAYRNILTSKPGDMNALQGLVSLLVQQNRPEAAIGLLQDTLKTATQVNEIQPGAVDIISVQLLLGQVYANEGRYNEALAIYDQSIETNEQDFRPLLAKALILKQQGRIGDAQPLFAQAVSLAPARYKDQVKQLAGDASVPASSPATEENPDRRETPTSPGS